MDAKLTLATKARSLFSNPWIGAVGAIASIIAIPLAIYFYFAGVERPDIRYYVRPFPSVLVRAGHPSDLTVSYKGQPVAASVTSATIVVWNAGKKPVARTDILEPIVLRVGNGAHILQSKPIKVSRSLIEYNLDEARISEGLVDMTFRILEHNDGAVIQLIYEGDPDTKISVDGAVVGQSHMSLFEDSDPLAQTPILTAVLGLYGALLGWATTMDSRLTARGSRWRHLPVGALMVIGFSLSVYMISKAHWWYWRIYPPL